MSKDCKSTNSGQNISISRKSINPPPSLIHNFSASRSPTTRQDPKLLTPTIPHPRLSNLTGNLSESKLAKKKREKKTPKSSPQEKPQKKHKKNSIFIIPQQSDEIHKLEVQVRYFKSLISQSPESQKLLQIIEKQNDQIVELEKALKHSETCEKHKKIISELKSDNINLIEKLENSKNWPKIEEWKFLLKKIQKLKEKCERLKKDKEIACDELERVKKDLPVGSLAYFVQDVWKIRKEVYKLSRVVEDLYEGKGFSLKGLLGIDLEQLKDPAMQLAGDIFNIKSDLNKISNIISDVHANQCAEIVCRPQ